MRIAVVYGSDAALYARRVSNAPLRIREAVQLGFTRIVMPSANVDPSDAVVGGR